MSHDPACLCIVCVPLGPAEARPSRCLCAERGGALTCSPEEQILCGWRHVTPGATLRPGANGDGLTPQRKTTKNIQ